MNTFSIQDIDKEAGLTQYMTSNGRVLRLDDADAKLYQLGEAEAKAAAQLGAKAAAAPANKTAEAPANKAG